MKEGETIGSYRILSHLGSGGMAEVYRVWNESLQREEALKLLAPQYCADRDFVARFLREAQLVAQLHHPNIAIIYSVSPPETTQPYFTMELLDGIDLSALLRRRGGRFFEPDAVHVLSQIASGLDYAHSRGVIHRDVKPSNVLVTREGASKLVDFGIARAPHTSDSAHLTQTGVIIGTPEYMSPEQARGDGQLGSAADQYSLGIIAYELLTGKVPFPISDTSSTMQVLMSHLQNSVPEPDQWDISPSVKHALLRVLSKEPEARYPSCQAFVAALVENQSQADVPTLPITAPRPKYLAGLVGISVLGLGMIGYSLLKPASSATSAPIIASVSPSLIGESSPPSLPKAPLPSPDANAEIRAAYEASDRAYSQRDAEGHMRPYDTNWRGKEGDTYEASLAYHRKQFAAHAHDSYEMTTTIQDIQTAGDQRTARVRVHIVHQDQVFDVGQQDIWRLRSGSWKCIRTLPQVDHAPSPTPTPRPLPTSPSRQISQPGSPITLKGKSSWELDILRNEAYARHGLIFRRDDLRQYFSRMPWYRPQTSDTAAIESQMSAEEKATGKLIREYQQRIQK